MIDVTVLIAFCAGVVGSSLVWLFAMAYMAKKSYMLGYADAKAGIDPYDITETLKVTEKIDPDELQLKDETSKDWVKKWKETMRKRLPK